VDEYFFLLRLVAQLVKPLKERALFYLAAAVSDFFIPQKELAEHKIQSRHGPLTLVLPQVPKLLGVLRHHWAPHAFYISFKLETDWKLLRTKAKQSIEKYAMHVVIANELKSRFEKIVLFTSQEEKILEKPEEDQEIEKKLIEILARMHYHFISTNQDQANKPNNLPVTLLKDEEKIVFSYRPIVCWTKDFIKQIKDHQNEILGVVLGGLLSVMLNMLTSSLRPTKFSINKQ
jgi:phosphopantothenate-cysteine ligase